MRSDRSSGEDGIGVVASLAGDDRGVSEVVAFTLVFVIIIGSVGFIYMTGFTSLSDLQEFEQGQNAERAMESLSTNLNDVQRAAGVSERSGEVNLRGGDLDIVQDNTTTMNVTSSGPGDSYIEDAQLGALTYSEGNSEIAYQAGGVFRGEGDASVVVSRPAVQCHEDIGHATITVTKIDTAERYFSADGTVEVTAVERTERTDVVSESLSSETVTVELNNTDYSQAWATSLERNGWDVDESGDTVTATCANVDRLTVRLVVIDIELA